MPFAKPLPVSLMGPFVILAFSLEEETLLPTPI